MPCTRASRKHQLLQSHEPRDIHRDISSSHSSCFFPVWEGFVYLLFYFKAQGGCRYKSSHLLQALPFLIPFQILHSLFSFSTQERKRLASKTRHRERKQRFTSPSKANYTTYYASHPFPLLVAYEQRGNFTFPGALMSFHTTTP